MSVSYGLNEEESDWSQGVITPLPSRYLPIYRPWAGPTSASPATTNGRTPQSPEESGH